ncbi:MAG: hypothetical protein AB1689_29385, partial [Thermodesulfobacteriota bacterium]
MTQPTSGPRQLAIRLLVVAGAVAVGLVLQQVVAERLEGIHALAERDVVAARGELALLLQVVGGAALALTTAAGVAIGLAGRR